MSARYQMVFLFFFFFSFTFFLGFHWDRQVHENNITLVIGTDDTTTTITTTTETQTGKSKLTLSSILPLFWLPTISTAKPAVTRLSRSTFRYPLPSSDSVPHVIEAPRGIIRSGTVVSWRLARSMGAASSAPRTGWPVVTVVTLSSRAATAADGLDGRNFMMCVWSGIPSMMLSVKKSRSR